MNLLQTLISVMEAVLGADINRGLGYIAAAISILAGIGTALGQGFIGAKAMSAIGKQPEAAGKIRITMMLAQVMAETSAIYAFIISIMILNKAV